MPINRSPCAATTLHPAIAWRIGADGTPLDARVVPLLAALDASGSLAVAFAQLGMPYRTGWGLLRAAERQLGTSLAAGERGRGATLTPAGAALLAASRRVEARLGADALTFGVPAASRASPAPKRLAIVASHDLALARIARHAGGADGVELALEVRGSLDALAAFAAGDTPCAGFHLPLGAGFDRQPFRRLLHGRRHRLARFVRREQGLIVAAGNPRRLRTLADLARSGVRFVNRQRGAGTRVLFDALLARERIAPATIAGYADEEHTHSAVAALVAAGEADVAFGLRAAAAHLGLGFVPVATEHYLFALNATDRGTQGLLARVLASAAAAAAIASLAGYSRDAGSPLARVDELLG